jgi:hypothetical protein
VTACAKKTTGALRLLKPGKKCKRTETKLVWSVTGPQGPQGAQGPAGTAGAPGAPGAPGTSSGSGVIVIDGNGEPVPGAYPDAWAVTLLRDGVLWSVGWDGKVDLPLGQKNAEYLAGYSDSGCVSGVYSLDNPVQRPVSVTEGAEIFLVNPTPVTGALYRNVWAQGELDPVCTSVGDATYYEVDLNTSVTKPADLVGPLKVSIG